jgi:rubredoxin
MKCTVCGNEFESSTPGERTTTVNQRSGRSVVSTVVTAVCPKCTSSKEVSIVIEKYSPKDQDVNSNLSD